MVWIILGSICAVALIAELCLIAPDKMPWYRKKEKK